MEEKDLYDLEFILGLHKIVDAYHINFIEYAEVISLNKRLMKYLEEKKEAMEKVGRK